MLQLFIVFLLLCGCGPSTQDDFLSESEDKCAELVAILEKVNSIDDLYDVENDLKKKFNEIGILMIKSRKYYEKFPPHRPIKPVPSSGVLMDELKRIYTIKGGREVIERAQADVQLW
jgi:hypothetical protein